MGFFDLFKSTHRPPAGTPVLPQDNVQSAILALNRDTAPYSLVDGSSEGVDIIAGWKIVDAKWYEVFAKASLSRVFKIYMKFDPAKNELRATDREFSVQWKAGIPSLSIAVKAFKGQKQEAVSGCGWTYRGVAFGKL